MADRPALPTREGTARRSLVVLRWTRPYEPNEANRSLVASRADLLKRIFEVDALRCPARHGRMRLLAAITDPSVARRILECLAIPPRAPPLAPANEIELEPVAGESVFERAPAEADGDPGFDFDQTQSAGWAPDDDS